MKPTPICLKFWLTLFLSVGIARSVLADPSGYVDGNYSASYTQTTSGTTSAALYYDSIGVGMNGYGDIDPVTYFPSSITFGGSAYFPGGQLEVVIPYDFTSSPVLQGTNYYGVAGGGTYGTAPSAGGYLWGSAGIWSLNASDLSTSLSATFNGGVLDGFTQSIAPFDVSLLPNAPLFTAESLAALASISGPQDIALTMILPFSPGFITTYGVSEIVDGNFISVLNLTLDPILSPAGFSISGSILLPGHDYSLYVYQSSPLPDSNGPGFDSQITYQTYNSVAFSVAAASVPDSGTTVALFGSALLFLCLNRRRPS